MPSFNDGQNITLSEARQRSTYESSGWQFTRWDIKEGVSFPFLRKDGYDTIPFPNGEDGTNVSVEDAKKQATYTSVGWDFQEVWGIHEGISYPRLKKVLQGQPLSSQASLMIIELDETGQNGTMFYNDEVYTFIKRVESKDFRKGEVGDEIVHTYFGETIQYEGETYAFFASGIQEDNTLGGYAEYSDEKVRTVALREGNSRDVAFYYIKFDGVPITKIATIYVQTNNGVIEIPVNSSTGYNNEGLSNLYVSSMGIQGFLGLVDVDDESASPIRVQTPEGIKAMKLADGYY